MSPAEAGLIHVVVPWREFVNPGNHLQTLISKALKGKKGGQQERSGSNYSSSSGSEGKVAREWATLRTRLNTSDSAQLAADYTSVIRVKDLAEKYGISRSRVHAHLVKHGVVRRPLPLNAEQVDRAVILYKAGMTLLEVAADLGSNTRAVTLALESKGIPRRPRGVRITLDWSALRSNNVIMVHPTAPLTPTRAIAKEP